LRACPSAPDPAVSDSEQDNENHQGDHGQEEKVKVLGPELHPQENNLPVDEIQQQQRLTVDPQERSHYEKGQQDEANNIPPECQLTLWLFCINPDPFAAFINGGKPVPEICLLLFLLLELNHDDLMIG